MATQICSIPGEAPPRGYAVSRLSLGAKVVFLLAFNSATSFCLPIWTHVQANLFNSALLYKHYVYTGDTMMKLKCSHISRGMSATACSLSWIPGPCGSLTRSWKQVWRQHSWDGSWHSWRAWSLQAGAWKRSSNGCRGRVPCAYVEPCQLIFEWIAEDRCPRFVRLPPDGDQIQHWLEISYARTLTWWFCTCWR